LIDHFTGIYVHNIREFLQFLWRNGKRKLFS